MPPRLPTPLLCRQLSIALCPRQSAQFPVPRSLPAVAATRIFLQQHQQRSYRAAPAPPVANLKHKRVVDEAIPGDIVNYLDLEGVFHEDVPVVDILSRVNRKTHHLVCVNPQAVGVQLICRIQSKEELEVLDRKKYHSEKEKRKKRKDTKAHLVLKEVEMSWAISEHDLAHRFKKIREFLDKGFKVSVTIGTKKGMAKQHLRTMQDLVQRVRGECEEWGREIGEPEGEVGRRYAMLFEGKRVGGSPVEEGSRQVEEGSQQVKEEKESTEEEGEETVAEQKDETLNMPERN